MIVCDQKINLTKFKNM